MCEVQGPGGAPGRSAGAGGASTPPGRLSVSSSESEEDQKAPRNSLLDSSEDGPSIEPAEGTSNSRDDSDVQGEEKDEEEEEEEEEGESSTEVVVVTLNIVEKTDSDNDKKNDDEEEKEEKEENKIDNEKETKEKDAYETKERKGSESEAKEVQDCVRDETEIENLENERRDELLENTVKKASEIKQEKMAHDKAEENTPENDEGASAAESLKEVEPQKQKEDEKEKREKDEVEEEGKDDKEQKQKVIVKEEEEETSKHSHEDQKKTTEKEEETKEIAKEKEKKHQEIKETKENGKQEAEKEAEGVDPFSPKCATEDTPLPPPTTTKVSKTVNFLESELKAISERKRHTINSYTSSTSSSSSKSKEAGEAKDDDMLERLEPDEKTSKHWTLGEGNPVYRLSLKLSPNLFNATDIPGANQHKEADKAGFLTKLSGRSFPYIAQWKRRYCVLSKGRLYYYEKEDSKAGDKSNGVIQLEYFDQVAEAGPKECKKATNVFIITSQDRSFFDPGRHVFSADTLPDMKDWIRKLQAALDQIRNNNRPAASTSPSTSPAKEGGGKRKDEATENKEGKGSQTATATSKERRKKKEDSSRPRKSSKTGVSSQTQTSMGEPPASDAPDGGRPAMAIPKGGVMLPGFSSRKDPQSTNRAPERRSGDGEAEEDLPQGGPTLTCVTKQRVKGPAGRRAPQSRRKTAAALKKRASSLSALEHQDASDNREAPWLNRSLDVLEGGNPWGGKQVGSAVPCSALPYKAYNYSTDEDDMDDDQSDSFPASASGMPPPPPPPPRSASYGLELMRSASQGRVAPRGRKVPRCSLDDARGSQADLGGSRDSLGGWRGSHGEAWGQNGRASPVMDDLDNLLMNQSVQHSSAALDSISDAGSEGSSTCRAADHQQPAAAPDHCHHHHHHHHQMQQGQQPRKKPQDLGRFTTAVRHLQRHVVEIDRAVFAVTGDVASTRREVTTLREAVAALQADAHTITTTLSNLTQEAITAQQKIAYATQSVADILPAEKEAEKVQLTVREALLEAERAKQEQMKSKREYDELVAEMKVALQFFKEASPVSVQVPVQDPASSTAPVSAAKSSSNSHGAKGSTGYQSLFSKSSSIISGFTSRHSLTKSVSFAAEQKEKRKSDGPENKANSLERDKKYDKKDKRDGKFQASLQTSKDKKDKHSDAMDKKDSTQQQHKQKALAEAGLGHLHRLENGEGDTKKTFTSLERRERRLRDKRAHVISPLSLEDIPMADDASHEHEAKSDPTAPATEPDSCEAQSQQASFKQTFSITLGQSSTGASSRPQVLGLSRDRHSGDLSTSNTSPESPVPPTSSTRPNSFLPTLEESPPVSGAASLSSLHQPGSTPGPQARQGAMSTVHKDRPLSTSQQTKRPGTFAISRQHSSPNIPIQRQNSGTSFPIQRQQSLGTVPEGRLPRQESLTSVPEERLVVDRTLPLSPSPSLTYFPLSSTPSSSTMSDTARRAARESMERVTGPVLAGSSIQEANATGTLPVLHLDEQNMQPAATSTLKRASQSHSDNVGILV